MNIVIGVLSVLGGCDIIFGDYPEDIKLLGIILLMGGVLLLLGYK